MIRFYSKPNFLKKVPVLEVPTDGAEILTCSTTKGIAPLPLFRPSVLTLARKLHTFTVVQIRVKSKLAQFRISPVFRLALIGAVLTTASVTFPSDTSAASAHQCLVSLGRIVTWPVRTKTRLAVMIAAGLFVSPIYSTSEGIQSPAVRMLVLARDRWMRSSGNQAQIEFIKKGSVPSLRRMSDQERLAGLAYRAGSVTKTSPRLPFPKPKDQRIEAHK